ncbi:MAG TPA: metal-sensitive transcriptional regulator [Sphaerochaeta sp.]|nr:metal-sensitive transcriptional regulator [Sphaerochaeta sp.]
MNEDTRKKVDVRLARIAGQVTGIRNMVSDERYCVDILLQLSAAISALKRVEHIVLESHLDTCVVAALQSNDETEREQKIQEVMEVIATFGKQ